MTDRSHRSFAGWLATLLTFIASPALANEEPDASALDRLRTAVAEHPEDPDLAWAYARHLADAGLADEAVLQTKHFIGRWPERRPDARMVVASRLIEARASTAAFGLIDDELAARPRSATAHFYRGLAFRIEGLLEEADREFQVAARLEPALRAETLLARALGLFEQGRDAEAVSMLKTILELDPTGDTALRARLMLRQREVLDLTRSWRIDGYAGVEWDSNVTLEGSESELGASDQADWRGIWGAGASWRPWIAERGSLTLGYRFDQSVHHDLDRFDLLGNTVFASASWLPTEQIAFRFDALAYNTLQDYDNELSGGTLRPNLIWSFGPDWGALRFFNQLEVLEYHDDPLLEQWDRDALVYGVGVEHFLPLRQKGSWLAVSGSWSRTWTDAGSDGFATGFDGDYDYDSYRARATGTFELPFGVRMQIDGAYSYDNYHNDNLSQFLSSGTTRQREDDVLSGRIGLSRELIRRVRAEAYWRGARRVSNVDLFDYDKQVAGLLFRVSTD